MTCVRLTNSHMSGDSMIDLGFKDVNCKHARTLLQNTICITRHPIWTALALTNARSKYTCHACFPALDWIERDSAAFASVHLDVLVGLSATLYFGKVCRVLQIPQFMFRDDAAGGC